MIPQGQVDAGRPPAHGWGVRNRNGVRGPGRPGGRSGSAIPAVRGVSPLILWVTGFGMFLSISRFHQFIRILAKLHAPELLTGGGLLLLVVSTADWRPKDLSRHWIPKGIGALLLIAIIGVPIGIYPGQSLHFITDTFGKSLLAGVAAWAVSRTPHGARFVARVIALSGVTTDILAILGNVRDNANRLGGMTTYDANDLALITVISLPLVVWWLADKGNRFRLFLAPAIPLMLWVLVQTGSRSGGLGLIAVVGAMVVIFRRRGMPRGLKRTSTIIMVGAALAVPVMPSSFYDRMSTIGEKDYNVTSETGRLAIWKRGIGYAVSHPFTGVGINNFTTAEGHLSSVAEKLAPGTGWKWSTAHNSFILVLAELGIPAGIIFACLIVGTVVALAWKTAENVTGELLFLAPFVGISFLGFAVSGFFLSFSYYDVLYMMFGLAAAILMQPDRPGRPVPRRPGG